MRIGIVGVGNMGEALARGLAAAGHEPLLFDLRADHLAAVARRHGARAAATAAEVAAGSEVVFLAVKPPQVVPLARDLAPHARPETVWVSVAAGIPLAALTKALGSDRVVRVMPNTPALIGEGMVCYACARGVEAAAERRVSDLLAPLGRVAAVDEGQMDAVTGLSGSGPAYLFVVIEALAEAGIAEGLPAPLALELAAQTVRGAGALALETGDHPALLRQRVTSPGGTTARGLAALEAGGLRAPLAAAVRAATARSRELGREPKE
ncbi:MAG: pyrroline-5-carboxylate reductase [Nitrospirae bacterium]|nr:MAG: pyrroline-5-carboxylate reductase [Nitrospirota bacterium]